MGGLIIAAPASGSGKTTVTLGLLRALKRRGVSVRAAKSGPDYIDPRFHDAACGKTCFNLDAWAMSPTRIMGLAGGEGVLVIEGAMGLFDGAPPDGRGATADLARLLRLPVVLVVDAGRMAQSIGPLVAGFARHDPLVNVAGVVLNRIGSDRHLQMLTKAVGALGLPVFGALPRSTALAHPSRHLGLMQAGERPDLERFLDDAADLVERHMDIGALLHLAGQHSCPPVSLTRRTPPAQRIAVAHDAAFAFTYPHLLADWRIGGAEITFFSPLADEAVPPADLIILPGGYPELHAGRLAAAEVFMASIRKASQVSDIYGECGGYMALGEVLTDAEGVAHKMAGLLPLETSFAMRRLHLGYRMVEALGGLFPGRWAAHEFHYATTTRATGYPLFRAWDAEGVALEPMGLSQGRVSGSFAHLIESQMDTAKSEV
ncbi:cobyrinate a,c-diamide synthase [Rubellimicrobium rubrum]|uniref:Hydrogenobyrinate a,c-diamide synthase n=1 Tax=Rubellimicrobium rubrum TaxID=2585369 RepID=A0A5C4N0X0_9RHOB|nr:cobyrinate a,c-diamide synthase [Rubellimicrobium rubrum]TNC50453.1 cobyrinate a,c-diamide synthase [Rubellimicrobium rubrum]